MGIKAALPRYELYLYTAVLGGALIWAASWIFEASSGEFMTRQRSTLSLQQVFTLYYNAQNFCYDVLLL